ncbi:MAG: type II toxin-antitoxin system prevent-host-death family antitoxin [Firmicutes bacterium]|nr:type II toxin-antitoxin system prevent-host-death family antitoxin [Bacillota bacterium]
MVTVNATQNTNLLAIVDEVAYTKKPRTVKSKRGSVVLLTKEDYENLMETIYLKSIPGMWESIQEGLNTPIEECVEIDGL